MQAGEALRAHLLREVDALAPALSELTLESEALGRLAPKAVDALRRTDLLRFPCPRELGGEEADPWTQTEVLEALAHGAGARCSRPLQRCLRDCAAGQHFVVSQSAYRAPGQFALGEPCANPML